jgi:hypothetical protein
MRENRTSGSARGVLGNRHSYREKSIIDMSEWYFLPGMGAFSKMYDSLKRELSVEAHFFKMANISE